MRVCGVAWGALLYAAGCSGPQLQLPAARPTAPSPAAPSSRVKPGTPAARAFVIERAADLLPGQEADGRLGDLKLDNGRVAFIIDAADSALGFADSGGNLIDAAPAGGEDALKQVFGYLDDAFPRQPVYDSVTPQQRGDAAVVNARGHDSLDPRLHVETEYLLRPGSNALEITTTVANTGSAPVSGYEIGDAIQWGRSERFAPGRGFSLHGRAELKQGWLLGLGDGVTYAYVIADGPLKGRHGSAWSDLNVVTAELQPGSSAHAKRWLVVGDGGGADVSETIAELRKEPSVRLWGHVRQDGSAAALSGMRVILTDRAGNPFAVGHSQGAGYELVVPAGDYRLRVEGRGRRGTDREVSLRGARTQVDLTLSRPGALAFEVIEGGTPSPARLTFVGLEPAGAAPGEGRNGSSARNPRLGPGFAAVGGNIALTVDGRGRVELAAGRYRVIASRGPAYTIDDQELTIVAGEEAKARFELKPAIDPAWLKSWLCADLHQHASPSADSGVALRDRAASNLAEGLEVLVATDHNIIADWAPVLATLGGTRPLALVAGNEATVDGLGHWNAYPLSHHPGQPRGGAFDVRGKTAKEIVAGLRAADGAADRVVQVNHPRAGFIGYFDRIKLDPKADALPPGWEGGFDAIEIFSTKDVSLAEAPMRDWFALLDRGLPYAGVGGSDSHTIFEQEVGYPRTCVPWDGKQPHAEALVSGIKKRRDALVTNGPFVRVSVGGRGMGQLAQAPRGKARLDVEVQAAPWVDTRRIEVFINGERRGKPVEIPASKAQIRYKDAIELKVTQDSWVVVLVRGEASLEPVLARREGLPATLPLAITNPIFLDRDGDGKYTVKKLTLTRP